MVETSTNPSPKVILHGFVHVTMKVLNSYEKIKKYVSEHNDGMKVTNLYIAQVKQKHGIIERQNYNFPKSGDAKQPQCPKEKEDAIVGALKYFRMI